MTDPKKNPNKQRRSFFWQRKPALARELARPVNAVQAIESKAQPWYRPTLLKVAVVALAVVAILPTHANGQFGIDTAAIMAALSKMQSLMNTYIAAPLKTINQYEQSTAKYEQEVMYPLTAINQAKTSVTQFENQFNQVSGIFRVNVSSATLPQSQNLEALLLSRNAANVPTMTGQFQNVYGVVMPQNAASPQMRTMTDMTDAQAQDAMKRAIEIDALADAELANCGYQDKLDRLTEVDYPDGGITTNCFYDAGAAVTTSKLLDSSTNTLETNVSIQDGMFHTKQTQLTSDPDGTTTIDMTYDGEGRLLTKSNPYRGSSTGTTTYSYDALGRPIQTQEQDGSKVQMCYDGAASTPVVSYCSAGLLGSVTSGTRVDTTDEAGSHWQRVTDFFGRLTEVMEPNGTTQTPTMETDYSYDMLNNLLRVDQWGGAHGITGERLRTFTYDGLSRLLTAANPETGTVTYKYTTSSGTLCSGDEALLCQKTDARSTSVTYGYDNLNRLLTKMYSDSEPTVSFTYDAYATGAYGTGNYGKGLRTGMTDASGSTTWTFDKMARPWVETRTIGSVQKPVGAEYNEGGSIKYQHYPSGASLHYIVGGAGRDQSVHDDTNSIQYALCATYAPAGQFATGTFGNSSCTGGGIQDSRQYNSRLQPASILVTSNAGTLMNLNYDFHLGSNDNGNLYTLNNYKDSTRTQTFTYDTLNRILTAQAPAGTHGWGISFTNVSGGLGIDPFGNLTQTTQITGKPLVMSVNQQVNTKNQFTLNGYGYDAAGNAVSDGLSSGCSGYGYSWNAEEMASCANGTTYTYNGDDERVKKSGGTLYWGGETGDALAESDLSGNLTSEYVFFNGKRIARRDSPSNSVYYYFSDHLGSSNVVTNATGSVPPLDESDYYPFGGEMVITNSLPNHYKFAGKERDSESGNDYFDARYYSSTMGRFMSPDWSAKEDPVPYANLEDPQSLNLYSYVRNNPLARTDPDGHCCDVTWQDVQAGLEIAGGAVVGATEGLVTLGGAALGAAAYSVSQGNSPYSTNGYPTSMPIHLNSDSGTEQGRDAQGKFLPKQGGEAQPGAAAEEQGLGAAGATKNTGEVINGTKRDGTGTGTVAGVDAGQHVEVKSGTTISNTKQLGAMAKGARATTGKPLVVVTTNPNAKLTGPAKNNPDIVHKPLNQ